MQIKLSSLLRRTTQNSWVVLLVKCLLVFVPIFVVCFCSLDLDFGWHLQAGNYFRAHGIPAHDIFTYTARSFPWIDHEWGTDVLFSWLYHLPSGYLLLSILFAGLWTAGLMVYAGRARLVFLLFADLVLTPYIAIRPTAWDGLGVAIVLRLLTTNKPVKLFLWLPLLFLLWANLHGGFVLGLGLILYFAVLNKDWRIAMLFLGCTAVTFINPYGPRLYIEIWRTLTDWSLHHQTIGMSEFYLSAPAWLFVGLWGVGFIAFSRKTLRNWLGLGPLLLAASLSATRYTAFFTLVATSELNDYYTRFKHHLPAWFYLKRRSLIYIFFIIITALAYTAVVASRISQNREADYPVAAITYLQQHPCPGNIFNDFNYGGYLIWKLPDQPVFIDGRMPSWRNPEGEKYMDAYFSVVNKPAFQKSVFKQYGIKCVLVGTASYPKLISSLKAQGWRIKGSENGATLLEL